MIPLPEKLDAGTVIYRTGLAKYEKRYSKNGKLSINELRATAKYNFIRNQEIRKAKGQESVEEVRVFPINAFEARLLASAPPSANVRQHKNTGRITIHFGNR